MSPLDLSVESLREIVRQGYCGALHTCILTSGMLHPTCCIRHVALFSCFTTRHAAAPRRAGRLDACAASHGYPTPWLICTGSPVPARRRRPAAGCRVASSCLGPRDLDLPAPRPLRERPRPAG